MEDLLPRAFAIYALFWVTWLITTVLFKTRLRVVAPDVAKKFAPPLFDWDIRYALPGVKFMLRRQYRSIGDPRLTRVGDLTWYLGWINLILLLAFGVLIALSNKGL